MDKNNLIKLDKDNLILYIISVLILLFYFIFFKITGLRFIIGIFLLYFLPMYLILDNFNFKKLEKIVFSFFIAIGIYPSLVYWIGYFIGNVRIGIVVAFVLLVGIGIGIRFYKNKKQD